MEKKELDIIESDNLWQTLFREAEASVSKEPLLASFLQETILSHNSIEDALSFHLASKMHSSTLRAMLLREIIDQAIHSDENIRKAIYCDLKAIYDRDAATNTLLTPFLYNKGFHALQGYRVANWLWKQEKKSMAYFLQNRMSEIFQVDIHPAAQIGCGIFIDHATSVVIGETAVVENDVSMLHEVTLGGTGKVSGDRHPKVRKGVLIGAGAKVLGNIEVGEGAKIGAGSVVLNDVPAHSTAVGVPALIIGQPLYQSPAFEMDHKLTCLDIFPDDIDFQI